MGSKKISIEEVIEQSIRAAPDPLWPNVWQKVYYDSLAQQVLSFIDFQSGFIRPGWHRLDNHYLRSQAFVVSSIHIDASVKAILEHRKRLEDAVTQAGFGKQSLAALQRQVRNVVGGLADGPAAGGVIATNPFPQAWLHVAHAVAARISAHGVGVSTVPETTLLGQLLAAAFFHSCELVEARLAEFVLAQSQQKPLGFRGSLLGIVEHVGAGGILDVMPPQSLRTSPVNLRNRHLSGFLLGIEDETQKVMCDTGIMHRLAASVPVTIPPGAQGLITSNQLQQGRSVAYREYEFAILGHLALSGIEQLLRAWASHLRVRHIKPSGQPESVLGWIKHIPCSAILDQNLRGLYDTKQWNIRNRVMHGALLEVGAELFHFAISTANPARYGATPQTGRSGFRSENVAKLCLDCLEELDSEVATSVQLAPSDFEWRNDFALSRSEVGIGRRMPIDFKGPAGSQLLDNISVYLTAMFPALPQMFRIGFSGWGRTFQQGDTLVCVMALASIFEAVYRLTVHLLGFSILQKDGRNGHYQYLMLDHRHLCSPQILDRVLEHVSIEQRGVAAEVIGLSVKFRNSVAHGAVVEFDEYTAKGVGHLLIKSILAMIGAGRHHMVQEAAYYRWQNLRHQQDGFAERDWVSAEADVHARLTAAADLWRDR